ncbi:MAG: pyridoxal phosphate-dependent aminotransferase [Thermoprotei archaeon]|jgi:aspartate/methionine/tyrosine aminotransferase
MKSLEQWVLPQIRNMSFTGIWRVTLLLSEYEDAVYLSTGEPDFDTPLNVVRAAEEAMKKGKTHYIDPSGLKELREEISLKLRRDNSIEISPDQVIVTAGAEEALATVFQTFVAPGDKVTVFTPAYSLYLDLVQIRGAKLNTVKLIEEEEGFRVDIERFKESVAGSKLVIINNPSNPTGYVMPDDEVRAIVEVASDAGALLVSDEIYEKMNYSSKKLVSPASIVPEKVITINGFSKAYAMTGWRVGYLAAPKDVVGALRIVHHANVISASSISQYAALEALRGPQDSVKEMVAEYKKRMEIMYRGLKELPEVRVIKPEGSIYAFPDFSFYGTDDDDFSLKLAMATHVATVPGSSFGDAGRGHLRFTFATSTKSITTAISRIKDFLSSRAAKGRGLIRSKPKKHWMGSLPMSITISVKLLEIHAEKLVEGDLVKVQMQTQLNAPSGPVERRSPTMSVIPFAFSVNFVPASGTLTFHGQIVLTGGQEDLDKISKDLDDKKPYLPALQVALNHSIATSILVCRELGLPFPLGIPQLAQKNDEEKQEPQQLPSAMTM